MTHPLDRREEIPKCVQNVNDSTFLLESVLIISLLRKKSEAGIQIQSPIIIFVTSYFVTSYLVLYADQYL